MAPRKKVSRAKAPAAKSAKRSRAKPAKTKALSVKEAIVREELPTRSAIAALNAQSGLLQAMLTWSPVNLIVGQQAAFWEGYTRSAQVDRPASQKKKNASARAKPRPAHAQSTGRLPCRP